MSRRRKNALLQRVEYLLYRAAARLVRSASNETSARWGSRIGDVARHILRSRDRLALRNLAETFPAMSDAERRRVIDECWRHFGREALATIRVQHLPPDEIAAQCPFVNTHLIEEALALGRGVILISAHFGAWEIGGLALMSVLKNVHTVARPLDNELLERDLIRLRAHTGVQVVDRKRAARPLLKALSHNGVVVLLADQAVQPWEGVLVPFLGRPAWTTDGPAKMALRQQTPIVFGFCIPDQNGHRLEFEEPIRIGQLGEDGNNADALTTRINDVISRRITERPELWLWMHDRWKGNAPGETESEASDGQ